VRDPADVREFLARDWDAFARAKEEHWLECRRRYGPAWGLLVGDEMRAHAMKTQPRWPSARERKADLAMHLRMIDVLHRTPRFDR
jgi:hypothetical protein